jgi:ribonuclease HI
MDIRNFFKTETPEENDKTLIAFTDGSAIDNGKPHCRAGYSAVWPYHDSYNRAEKLRDKERTNNRAEYMALVMAFDIANEIDPEKQKTLIIYSDSLLLIKSLTEWIYAWKKNNWKKRDGKPVLNRDLLEMIEAHREERKLVMRHVKAHTNNNTWEAKYNDIADQMARRAALSR